MNRMISVLFFFVSTISAQAFQFTKPAAPTPIDQKVYDALSVSESSPCREASETKPGEPPVMGSGTCSFKMVGNLICTKTNPQNPTASSSYNCTTYQVSGTACVQDIYAAFPKESSAQNGLPTHVRQIAEGSESITVMKGKNSEGGIQYRLEYQDLGEKKAFSVPRDGFETSCDPAAVCQQVLVHAKVEADFPVSERYLKAGSYCSKFYDTAKIDPTKQRPGKSKVLPNSPADPLPKTSDPKSLKDENAV